MSLPCDRAAPAHRPVSRPHTLAALLTLAALGCNEQAQAGDMDLDRNCDEDCPYADGAPSLGTPTRLPLRTRIVEEDPPVDITDSDPFKMLAQDEIERARISLSLRLADGQTLALPEVQADEEGYVDAQIALPAGIGPGAHTLVLGVNRILAGEVPARVLAADHQGIAVRSDVDMTYLLTDFHSALGLAELMESDSREREALPGMPAVYRALRAGADGSADRPLCFISGSPRFFKRTLQGRMQLDGVQHDGLVLKPFKDIITANILSFDFDQIQPELEEQIGYKMSALLRLRLDLPPTTPEILMGDDTEADHVVYALYHRFTAGALTAAALDAELGRLSVAESWRAQVRQLAPQVAAHMQGQPAPVRLIYINRTDTPGEAHAVADWTVPGMTRHHRGAWPLILDLFEEGHVSEAAVGEVRRALDTAGVNAEARAAAAAEAVGDGFVQQATVDRFRG